MPDSINATMIIAFLIVLVALIFDFTNGFHDAANSIATVVSTRVLSPRYAVTWAASFNFIAFAFFGTRVAKTIGGDLVRIDLIQQDMRLYVLCAALIGRDHLEPDHLVFRTADLKLACVDWGLRRRGHRGFSRRGRLAETGGLDQDPGLHCGLARNRIRAGLRLYGRRLLDIPPLDAGPSGQNVPAGPIGLCSAVFVGPWRQRCPKTMGIITVVLASAGLFNLKLGAEGSLPQIPIYVVLLAHAAIALGTLSGGWRIVHTMGSKITKLRPVGGFSAETAGAVTLFAATFLGIPVSTTHTITGAIAGVGSTTRLSAVKWRVAGRIVWAWILTITRGCDVRSVSVFHHGTNSETD